MSSILSVTTITPSTGTAIGIGTAGGSLSLTGDVGIGTVAPLTALDVRGTTHALGNGGAALVWGNTSNLGTLSYSGTDAVINASNNLLFNVNGAERLRITSSGHIGVNESSPNKSGLNADARVLTISGPKRGVIELRGNIQAADTIGSIRFFSANNNEAEITSVTDGSYNGDLRLSTNGNERLRISSGGNVRHFGGDNRMYTFSSDDTAHYMKFNNTLNGIILNGYGGIAFETNGANERVRIDSSGHVLPGANNTYDLGSVAKGWRNVYMNDLNLSNMKGNTNDVDGTQGSWTIQEGKNDLYIINRLNGKKFKIKMEEVS